MMATTLQNLKALRKLFSGPETWIQGTPATDAKERCVNPDSPGAVCFCIMGGVSRVTCDQIGIKHLYVVDNTAYGDCITAIDKSIRGLGVQPGIAAWNDDPDRTYEDVMAVIDQAIEWERMKLQ